MASMQCDICGKRLTMDVSGEFAVCDYCGIKHPKARLMKKVSGINGNNVETKEQFERVSFTSEPAPQPAPEPIPQPTPQPIPQPIPQPTPTPIPQPIPAPEPTPAVTVENVSDIALQPESVKEPQPIDLVYSEPIFVSRASSQESEMGTADKGTGMDIGSKSVSSTVQSTNNNTETDGMTAAELAEFEKKKNRIEELKAELKEFEAIYEENKNKFLGEGLKRKNYSESKIKEIREKLDELGA